MNATIKYEHYAYMYMDIRLRIASTNACIVHVCTCTCRCIIWRLSGELVEFSFRLRLTVVVLVLLKSSTSQSGCSVAHKHGHLVQCICKLLVFNIVLSYIINFSLSGNIQKYPTMMNLSKYNFLVLFLGVKVLEQSNQSRLNSSIQKFAIIWSTVVLPILGSTGSTSYVGIGQVQNDVLYLRYTSNFAVTKAKHLHTNTFHYSIVESAPRIPLTFLKVEKIVCKNICFVLLLSFFLSFPSRITKKL